MEIWVRDVVYTSITSDSLMTHGLRTWGRRSIPKIQYNELMHHIRADQEFDEEIRDWYHNGHVLMTNKSIKKHYHFPSDICGVVDT